MITTSKEWKREYTTDGQWTIHIAEKKLAEDNTLNSENWKEWRAEIKWTTKEGKIKKRYQLTEYEYIYGTSIDDEDCWIEYNIISRRQYKSRNALMNAIRDK